MRIGVLLVLSLFFANFSAAQDTPKTQSSHHFDIQVMRENPAPSAVAPETTDLDGSLIYKQSLPSVMTLSCELKSGDQCVGTGFLALKDGVAVTAWHVVKGAKRVTAKFSDGQEFEVSGLIDKDEKRDIALVRVKAIGRPLLRLATGDPEIGSKAYAIGTSLGVLDFSFSDGLLSQIRTHAKIKRYQFTSAVSPGNSGGPLLNGRGEVIGIVDSQITEGQNLNFAMPAAYAQNLDETLPTQPWEQVQSTAEPSDITDNDEIDKALADSMVVKNNAEAASLILRNIGDYENRFKYGIPTVVYVVWDDILRQGDVLADMESTDPVRERLRQSLLESLAAFYRQIHFLRTGILGAQRHGGWLSVDSDYAKQGEAVQAEIPECDPQDLAILWQSSAFTNEMPKDIGSKTSYDNLVSAWETLGVITWADNDLTVADFMRHSLAEKLGLKPGDRLISVDNQALNSLAEFETIIEHHLNTKLQVAVERNGKRKEFEMSVPKEIKQPNSQTFHL